MTGSIKTTLIATGVALVLLLGALAFVPFLLEDRVLELVRTQANGRLGASVDFEDLDLSLLSTFPTLTVEINGLDVTGKGVFEGRQLASVPRLAVGLDLTRLILDEQLLIESFTLDDPELHFLVNEDGEVNYDITKGSDEEPEPTVAEAEPRAFAVRLRQFEITGGLITYDAPGIHVSIEGLDHSGSAVIDDATYALTSSTTVEALTLPLRRIRCLRNAKASLNLR
ncbi:MAG: AsmA family protein, partial [Myxococcales bacterium]